MRSLDHKQMKRRHTLSFYCMVAGLFPGKWGARIWLSWSLASLGIVWDRATSCDARNFRLSTVDKRFAATHLVFLPLALWRLR